MKSLFFRIAAFLGYTCRQSAEDYTRLADGALPWGARLKMRIHVAICGACQAYRGQMKAVTQAARATASEEAPPVDKARLLELYRAKRGGS